MLTNYFSNFSTTWKTGGSSWKEWHTQASHLISFTLAPSSLSTPDSSSSLTMPILLPVNYLLVARRLSSPWSSQTPTFTLERSLSPSIKTVSLYQSWRWADLLLKQLVDSLAPRVEPLPTIWPVMFALVWRSWPMVLYRSGTSSSVQLTLYKLRFINHPPSDQPTVPMLSRMPCTVAPTTSRRRPKWAYGSQELAELVPCSPTAPALWLSHTLFSKAWPDKSLTQSWPRVSRSLPCRCSTSIDQLLKNSLKFTRECSPSSPKWLSRWLQVLALPWRSAKRTLSRHSAISLAQWTPRLQRILDLTL